MFHSLLTLWTVARQTPLSMEFSQQEYWSGLPSPPLGDLPSGFFTTSITWVMGLPDSSDGKEFYSAGDSSLILRLGRFPLEKGMAAHSSILAWRIAWTEEPGRLQSVVSQRDGHDWVWLTHFFTSSWVVVGGQESSVGRGQLQRLSFKLGSELLHFSKLEFLPGGDAREEHPVRPFGWAHAQSIHLTDLDQTMAEATGTGWTNRFPWACSSS